jgi:ankyrin repeat protein
VQAQGWQPTQPVELVVPAGTGGGADQMARLIQKLVAEHSLMPQPVQVSNKAGNSGVEGLLYMKAARGDPHKLVITLSNLFTAPLAAGADVNHATAKEGTTSIYAASSKGHLSVVQRLVLGGANVNQRSHEGWTPLLIACYSGHDLVADYLIGRSADTEAVIRGRKNCMEWASSKGHAKCVEALQASIERAKLL